MELINSDLQLLFRIRTMKLSTLSEVTRDFLKAIDATDALLQPSSPSKGAATDPTWSGDRGREMAQRQRVQAVQVVATFGSAFFRRLDSPILKGIMSPQVADAQTAIPTALYRLCRSPEDAMTLTYALGEVSDLLRERHATMQRQYEELVHNTPPELWNEKQVADVVFQLAELNREEKWVKTARKSLPRIEDCFPGRGSPSSLKRKREEDSESVHESRDKSKRESAAAEGEKGGGVTMQRLRVPIIDPFSRKVIRIPARGDLCEHKEVFDLNTFVLALKRILMASNTGRSSSSSSSGMRAGVGQNNTMSTHSRRSSQQEMASEDEGDDEWSSLLSQCVAESLPAVAVPVEEPSFPCPLCKKTVSLSTVVIDWAYMGAVCGKNLATIKGLTWDCATEEYTVEYYTPAEVHSHAETVEHEEDDDMSHPHTPHAIEIDGHILFEERY